jgi:hypothetical protein
MSKQRGLTQSRLKTLLHYDPDTGIWQWIARSGPGSHVCVGDIAGTINKGGYLRIKLDCELYMAHCLAWLYMTGEWPQTEVDHRDCDPDNIRWENLRLATSSQNGANKRIQRNNKCGFKGVTVLPSGRYRAVIKQGGYVQHIGCFDTPADAHSAYAAAAKEKHGEFARAE